MALTSNVAGTLIIGSGTDEVKVPLSTDLPPTNPGTFAFSYEESDIDKATKIPVGTMIEWAVNELASTTKVDDLPDSLKNLSIAVQEAALDTTGKIDLVVQIGKVVSGAWDADWQPISGLDLKLSQVTLGFHRTTADPPAKKAAAKKPAKKVAKRPAKRPAKKAA